MNTVAQKQISHTQAQVKLSTGAHAPNPLSNNTNTNTNLPVATVLRDDIAAAIKSLAPSAKEWLTIVSKTAKTNADLKVAKKEKPPKKQNLINAKRKVSEESERAKKNSTATKFDPIDDQSPAPIDSTEDNDADYVDVDAEDEDEVEEHFDQLVKFVFEQNADNPWDERLFKWVMANFDNYSQFLNAPLDPSELIPPSPLASLITNAKSKIASSADDFRILKPNVNDPLYVSNFLESYEDRDILVFLKSINIESGGRVTLSVEHREKLKEALRAISATYPQPTQPKQTISTILLNIASIDSAIEKERENFHSRIKNACDTYLCLAVKTMNALFDFDDEMNDKFLKEDGFKKLRAMIERMPVDAFGHHWNEIFPDHPLAIGNANSASKNDKKDSNSKGKRTGAAKSIDINSLSSVDSAWELYLKRTAELTLELTNSSQISVTSVSNIVSVAQKLQGSLLVSLNEMATICKSILPETNELLEGTRQNLFHFRDFLNTESQLFKDEREKGLKVLDDLKEDLRKEYYTDKNNATGRGRVERVKNREFIKKLKYFDAEHRKFRLGCISSFEGFAENVQWDGLVLGVEVVGACLDIADEDLGTLHEPIQSDWEELTATGDLFKRRHDAIQQYNFGIKFGLFEYVKAIGKPLMESMNKLPAVAAKSTASSSPAKNDSEKSGIQLTIKGAIPGIVAEIPIPKLSNKYITITEGVPCLNLNFANWKSKKSEIIQDDKHKAVKEIVDLILKLQTSRLASTMAPKAGVMSHDEISSAIAQGRIKLTVQIGRNDAEKIKSGLIPLGERITDEKMAVVEVVSIVKESKNLEDISPARDVADLSKDSSTLSTAISAEVTVENATELSTSSKKKNKKKKKKSKVSSSSTSDVPVVDEENEERPKEPALGDVDHNVKASGIELEDKTEPTWGISQKQTDEFWENDQDDAIPVEYKLNTPPSKQSLSPLEKIVEESSNATVSVLTSIQSNAIVPEAPIATLAPLPTLQLLNPPHLIQSNEAFSQHNGSVSALEFQSLHQAYSGAMIEIQKLHTDCGMFVQEICRLNAAVAHWKGVAESLHNQQLQQQNSFYESSASILHQQPQQAFINYALPFSAGPPPGIQIPTLSTTQSSSSKALPYNGSVPILVPSPLGDLFDSTDILPNKADDEERKDPDLNSEIIKSPASWRKSDASTFAATKPGIGSRSIGVIGNERRMARPSVLNSSARIVGGSSSDGKDLRRAFLRGGRELRCGNCGEAGHESNKCNAPCR
ncbi:hypothetical protein HK100_005236 [Physocladia obscura]|uniref:CCHC-type domain-containing protein n=1 Tax=Physocladia obscura TaxID=109957 RepID=A0AAD5TBT6_9FUNG|nr:hypothetical protein HK100_005236 [Physocladia obscura]